MWFSLWRVDDHPYHPKTMEFRPQHIQPTKASLCWKAAVVFCRTRRVVGSSDASPLFGDPIWHFGNVRRGNRISGSHSRQQEITTSRREMTWNDSKPLGPSGQTSKSCLLQSFEFIVEEHQRQKKRHNFFEAQNVFYYRKWFQKKTCTATPFLKAGHHGHRCLVKFPGIRVRLRSTAARQREFNGSSTEEWKNPSLGETEQIPGFSSIQRGENIHMSNEQNLWTFLEGWVRTCMTF